MSPAVGLGACRGRRDALAALLASVVPQSRVDNPEVRLGLLTGDEAHEAYRTEAVKVGCNQSCDLDSLVGYEPTSAPAPG